MQAFKHSLALLPLLAGLAACDDFSPHAYTLYDSPQGELRWTLDTSSLTKASDEIPDTNDFILTIKNADGKTLYEGSYGDSPEALQVDAGSYTVSIVSIAFTAPAFARPQYGDEQVVVIQGGQSVTVHLYCTLRNAGVRLKIAEDFLTSFPDGVLYVKQGSTKLQYKYKETRIAYMLPQEMSVLLYNAGKDETLFTRTLSPREILTISISAPGASTTGKNQIQVQVDTLKDWVNDVFVIGGGNQGGGNSGEAPQDAISVAEVASHVGEKEVWVYGYIVGGDLTSAGSSVKTSNISKATHLALADRSSVTTKASCLAVELPKGEVRDALNLVDHPDLIGSRVYVKGELVESYFGTKGMKGTSDFVLK